jgi:hypothetical protein
MSRTFPRSYRAFERTLIGNVDPRSVTELALIHRLANLLWRLRRGGAIETGLFEIRGAFLLARCQDPPADSHYETATIGSDTAADLQARGVPLLDCRALEDETNRRLGFLRFLPGHLRVRSGYEQA